MKTARHTLTTNIKLALPNVGRWCMNLKALLYATFNLCMLCTETFHHNWQVYIGVQNEQNKVFFTSMEHNKLYGIALIIHCLVQLTSLCHHIGIVMISRVISYNMAKILDLIDTSPMTMIYSADDHQAQAENKQKYKNIRKQFDLDKLQDPTHSSGRSSISNHLVYISLVFLAQ